MARAAHDVDGIVAFDKVACCCGGAELVGGAAWSVRGVPEVVGLATETDAIGREEEEGYVGVGALQLRDGPEAVADI